MQQFSRGSVWSNGSQKNSKAIAQTHEDEMNGMIVLEDFSNPQHVWQEMNDPVMGGRSVGNFTIDTANGTAHFLGRVKIVPFLGAPGFIKAETKANSLFPDISSCQGLQFNLLPTSRYDYSGYRVSFGHNRPPHAFRYIYGYKANLDLTQIVHASPSSSNEAESVDSVRIPFTSFTDNWDAGTGDAIVTCQEDSQFCPDQETLQHNLYSIGVWGEGVEGDVDLKIKSIAAYDCFSGSSLLSSSFAAGKPSGTAALKQSFVGQQEQDQDDERDLRPFENSNPDEIVLENFAHPVNSWATLNDPVMGGRSKSSLTIENGIAHFEGQCNIVPSLQAPGFITMVTGGYQQAKAKCPNVSMCSGLKLVLRSTTAADYTGYYISFGTVHLPDGRYATGYKAPLVNVPTGGNEGPHGDFGSVVLPFSDFSAKWDDETGKIMAPCGRGENVKFCPNAKTLRDMQTLSIWGEGVEGSVDLEIQSIRAVGCASSSANTTGSARPSMVIGGDGGTGLLFVEGSLGLLFEIVGGLVVMLVLMLLLVVLSNYPPGRGSFPVLNAVGSTKKKRSDYTELKCSSSVDNATESA
ncbi:hypothetical protein ACA910_008043 [Epithemia clementina (nom. ined.)]